MQEEDLRETLDCYAVVRERKGLGPSKIRECDIEEARTVQKPIVKNKGGRVGRQRKR